VKYKNFDYVYIVRWDT